MTVASERASERESTPEQRSHNSVRATVAVGVITALQHLPNEL